MRVLILFIIIGVVSFLSCKIGYVTGWNDGLGKALDIIRGINKEKSDGR